MSSLSKTDRRQILIVIAVAIAALIGLFFVGRGTASDETADSPSPRRDAAGTIELPAVTALALAGRTPRLIAPKPPEVKPADRKPADEPAAEPTTTTTSTTAEAPVASTTETTVAAPPPAPAPAPPAPTPEPPPDSGSGGSGGSGGGGGGGGSVPFDDSG